MYDKVVEVINQYEEKGDFTYAVVNDVIIADAEKVLNVNIPEQYQWFLKRYDMVELTALKHWVWEKMEKQFLLIKH